MLICVAPWKLASAAVPSAAWAGRQLLEPAVISGRTACAFAPGILRATTWWCAIPRALDTSLKLSAGEPHGSPPRRRSTTLGLTCTRQAHLLLEGSFHGCWLHRVLHTTIQRCAVSVGALWARQLECLQCPAATRRVARAPFTSNTPAVTRHRRNPTDQTSSRSRLICASPAAFKTEE